MRKKNPLRTKSFVPSHVTFKLSGRCTKPVPVLLRRTVVFIVVDLMTGCCSGQAASDVAPIGPRRPAFTPRTIPFRGAWAGPSDLNFSWIEHGEGEESLPRFGYERADPVTLLCSLALSFSLSLRKGTCMSGTSARRGPGG